MNPKDKPLIVVRGSPPIASQQFWRTVRFLAGLQELKCGTRTRVIAQLDGACNRRLSWCFDCHRRDCRRCLRLRLMPMLNESRSRLWHAAESGANLYSAVLTWPKQPGFTLGDNLQHFRGAWDHLSKHFHDRMAHGLVGYAAVTEFGKRLSPHLNLLLATTPEIDDAVTRLRHLWQVAVCRVLGRQSEIDHMQCPVETIDRARLDRLATYLAKGDPIDEYTSRQLKAYLAATRGFRRFNCSRTWRYELLAQSSSMPLAASARANITPLQLPAVKVSS